MDERKNEEEEHTNAWQAADNVSQTASNADQARDNVKQTASNVAQTEENVRRSDANLRETKADNVKQAADNSKQSASNTKHAARRRRGRRINYVQTFVYVMLAFVVGLSLWLDNRNSQADKRERCEAGVDSRNVDRAQVQGFYSFVNGLLPTEKETAQLPAEDQKSVRRTQKQLIKYRVDLFKEIHPSKLCASYVDDDNVTPAQWEKENPPPPYAPRN